MGPYGAILSSNLKLLHGSRYNNHRPNNNNISGQLVKIQNYWRESKNKSLHNASRNIRRRIPIRHIRIHNWPTNPSLHNKVNRAKHTKQVKNYLVFLSLTSVLLNFPPVLYFIYLPFALLSPLVFLLPTDT